MQPKDKKQFCTLVRKSLPDEADGQKMYGEMQELLESSENPAERALAFSVSMIKADEGKHGVTLEDINRLVCSTM